MSKKTVVGCMYALLLIFMPVIYDIDNFDKLASK